MVRPRILTQEERTLWKQVTRNDAKFHADGQEEMPAPAAAPAPQAWHIQTTARAPAAKAAPAHTSPLALNDTHALDGLLGRRLKRGEVEIDRVLDLHGYGRIDAYSALERHIRSMAANGERVLAVITGKGRTGEGVLKRELPHWLNDGALRPYVLAACHAPYRMGGEGAVLVMLTRKR